MNTSQSVLKPGLDLRNGTFRDGGPIYTETRPHRMVVEPFNAMTAAIFLWIAIYWFRRLRQEPDRHRFLEGCMLLLAVGGVGGTLFHALRCSKLFFVLDILPIDLLTVGVGVYLWMVLLDSPWRVVPILIPFVILYELAFWRLPRYLAISASYCILALILLWPAGTHLVRTRYANWGWLASALVLFAVGVVFRSVDPYSGEWIPIGTHWLWHLFSAASVFAFTTYLYRLRGDLSARRETFPAAQTQSE